MFEHRHQAKLDQGCSACLDMIDACVTLKAQGPPRTCNESKEKEEEACPDIPVAIQERGMIPHEVIQANRINPFQKGLYSLKGRAVP